MNSQVRLVRTLVILGTASLSLLAGCGGSTGSALNPPPAANSPPPPSPALTGMEISPSSATLEPGGVQQFTATLSPAGAKQAVTWSLSGTGCEGAGCGTIDAAGRYTAPAAGAKVPFLVKAIAVPTAEPDWSRTAVVTVSVPTSDNTKLSGRYAVLLRGSVPDEAAQVVLAASFVADGNGHLTAGEGDMLPGGDGLTLANSTYSVGADNQGFMSLDFVRTDNSHISWYIWFALDLLSPAGVATHGSLAGFLPLPSRASGFLVKQDPGLFSTAAINGDYAFSLVGIGEYVNTENVALGRFTASGGSISAGHIDLVGFRISDRLQSDLSFTGTYSVRVSGRGVATLDIPGSAHTLNIVFYVISSGEMLWIEVGAGRGAAGTALQQSGRPFTASSLNSTAVFATANIVPRGGSVIAETGVGEVQFDGMGNLTGTSDGVHFTAPPIRFADEPIGGTYSVDSNGLGRGTIVEVKGPGLTLFYLVSPNRGFILSGNGTSAATGTFEPQTGSPFSDSSFAGTYVWRTDPLPTLGFSWRPAAGGLSANGIGGFSGSLEGTQTIAGTYSVTPNGRTTLSPNIAFYFVSPAKAVGIGPSGSVSIIER